MLTQREAVNAATLMTEQTGNDHEAVSRDESWWVELNGVDVSEVAGMRLIEARARGANL
jgi:hypothetical protein